VSAFHRENTDTALYGVFPGYRFPKTALLPSLKYPDQNKRVVPIAFRVCFGSIPIPQGVTPGLGGEGRYYLEKTSPMEKNRVLLSSQSFSYFQ